MLAPTISASPDGEKRISIHLPKRDELLLRSVYADVHVSENGTDRTALCVCRRVSRLRFTFAFPNASRIGDDARMSFSQPVLLLATVERYLRTAQKVDRVHY